MIDFPDQELLLLEQQVLLGDRLDQLSVEFAQTAVLPEPKQFLAKARRRFDLG